MGHRWAGVSLSCSVITKLRCSLAMGLWCASFLVDYPLWALVGGKPSERSSPCFWGCVQVSGLAGSEALLFLVVPGAARTPLLGCLTESHGKH